LGVGTLDFLLNLDYKLFSLINCDESNPLFDMVMPTVTNRGYLLFIPFAFVLAGGIHKNGPKKWPNAVLLTLGIIIFSFCTAILADFIGNLIKHAVQRPRPFYYLPDVRMLVGRGGSYSMPSNHAVNTFAFAASITYLSKKYVRGLWRLYPFLVAVLVAFSRVYVGAHYPSDVLAGALLGAAVATLIIAAAGFLIRKISP
jgi:membrane-associated phospholipid phosphatase